MAHPTSRPPFAETAFRTACSYLLLPVLLAAGCQRPPSVPASETETPSPQQTAEPAAQPLPSTRRGPVVSVEGLPKTVDGRVVLATAPATPNNALQYELSIGACVKKVCPVLISLIEDGKVLDQARAEWDSTTIEPVEEEVTLGWGVGDPSGPPDGTIAWMTGEEEGYLGTAVRAVSLSPAMNGLLVDQRSGFEHVKRHHELFVHRDRRLRRSWSAAEGAGPAWTSTAIAPTRDGRDAVVLFEGFRYPQNDEPDTMKAVWLEWDEASGTLAPRPPATPIEVSAIRGFETIAAARAAKSRQRDCLGAFWVLPEASVDATAKAGFVVAMPSLDRDKALASARCATDHAPELLPLRTN